MKKILLTLTAVLALTLTGCNTGTPAAAPSPMPAPTVTVTATPEPEPEVEVLDTDKMSEAAFLRMLRGENPELNAWEDDQIMDHAERVCVELDGGATLNNLIEGTLIIKGALHDSGYGSPLGTVIAGTVMTYCPQHKAQVSASLSS